MWSESTETLPSVLIVEGENGDVFIVESKEDKPQVDKILKTENKLKSPRKKVAVKIQAKEPTVVEYKLEDNEAEDDQVIEEYLEPEYLDEYFTENQSLPVPFVDPNQVQVKTLIEYQVVKVTQVTSTSNFVVTETIPKFKSEPEPIPAAILDHQYMMPQVKPEEKYSSDDFDERSDDETLGIIKLKGQSLNKGKMQKHKYRQLTGKAACKFCDTIFQSKESLKMHHCKYLVCNPKNFICRICKKELSKKTFSNHLHETLDCQYCGKKFVNPRNMKKHILMLHAGEKYVPPKSPNLQVFQEFENQDETQEPVLDETTGEMMIAKKQKKKYPRVTGRFECDLCGRLFTTVRSLKIHMDLHTNTHRYICQTCGEKYTTHTGISKHACLNKKRKRPEVDFRIFDVRYCKYCGCQFANLEANKEHQCEFQFEHDPKMFRCRFCLIDMSKNSYNKHMNRHLDPNKEFICGICDKRLSDETGLNIHLTTHTGDKPYKCPYEGCGQSFINKQLLTRHSRFHGADIPTYSCGICKKDVASKYHLKTHMKLHMETVECQLCKNSFETKDALKEHYASCHVPYPCSQCDKSFILPRYLKMHEKLHTPLETKPHICDYCIASKSFSKLALLMNHIYKVHTESFESWKQNHPEIFKSATSS